MTRPTTLATGTLLLALVLSGCGGSSTTPAAPKPTSGGAAPTTGTTTAAGTPLTIKGFAFSPKLLTVKVGTTVTATNQDSAPHTWTSGPASFDSKNLDQGKSFSFTFKTPGTFTYVCTYHKQMVGTVVVTS